MEMEQEPPIEICPKSLFKEFEEAFYGKTCGWSYQENEKMMDIDEFLESYTLLLEKGDDVQSDPKSTKNEFLDPVLDDMVIKFELVMRQFELVIEPDLDSRRYQPYIPTILMLRCSYFPSFGGEKVVDGESQGHMVFVDKIGIPTT